MSLWEIHALKYAERNTRIRGDSFLFDDDHASPHAMDYYVWLLEAGDRRIVVDTGYDAAEGRARGRPIETAPQDMLAQVGVETSSVDTVILTHLHYDHMMDYPRLVLQRWDHGAAQVPELQVFGSQGRVPGTLRNRSIVEDAHEAVGEVGSLRDLRSCIRSRDLSRLRQLQVGEVRCFTGACRCLWHVQAGLLATHRLHSS